MAHDDDEVGLFLSRIVGFFGVLLLGGFLFGIGQCIYKELNSSPWLETSSGLCEKEPNFGKLLDRQGHDYCCMGGKALRVPFGSVHLQGAEWDAVCSEAWYKHSGS